MLDGAEWRALRLIEQRLEWEDPALADALARGESEPADGTEEMDPRFELLGAAFVIMLGVVAAVGGAIALSVGLLVAAVVLLGSGVLWGQRGRRLIRGNPRPS